MAILEELYPDTKKERYCVGLVILILAAFLLFLAVFSGNPHSSTDTSSSTSESSAPAKDVDDGGYTVPENNYTPPKYQIPPRSN